MQKVEHASVDGVMLIMYFEKFMMYFRVGKEFDGIGMKGGRREEVQDGEHMYTCGRFIAMFGKTNTIL